VYIKRGVTRTVLVFKHKVIKFPTVKTYKLFLQGIMANLVEGEFSGIHSDLARVLHYNKLGLFLVMERAEPVIMSKDVLKRYLKHKYRSDILKDFLLSDCKPENWGYIDGRLKKIDYA
jgi:hypothetical protein